MRTIKEIDEEIVREYGYMNQLYAQIDSYEQNIKHLKAEREDVKKEEEKHFIDNWLNEHFGIPSQEEARKKSIFIVFDENFKEQLENLCWEFDKNGKLKKTQW